MHGKSACSEGLCSVRCRLCSVKLTARFSLSIHQSSWRLGKGDGRRCPSNKLYFIEGCELPPSWPFICSLKVSTLLASGFSPDFGSWLHRICCKRRFHAWVFITGKYSEQWTVGFDNEPSRISKTSQKLPEPIHPLSAICPRLGHGGKTLSRGL